MRRRWIILISCILLSVIGWNIWDTYFRASGEDWFDAAFWNEFDADRVVNHFDQLKETGLFDYYYANEYSLLQQLRWPKEMEDMDVPTLMLVQQNTYSRSDGDPTYHIYWEKGAPYNDSADPEKSKQYSYTIYIRTTEGQIWLRQKGNSRKECMDQAQENLLWLMSLI